MPNLSITPNIEKAPWEDLNLSEIEDGGQLGEVIRIGRLPRGTQGGKSTVAILVRSQSGKFVMVQTTLRLLWNAVKAMEISAQSEGEDCRS